MSLTELIAGVENHEKTLTVYNADEEATEALREQFRDRNLTVRAERTPSGTPARFAVLSKDEVFVTAAGLEEVLGGAPGDGTDLEFEAGDYQPILDHLDETMFTSYDTGQMVAASREIEDRAWRLGKGSIHAGFQKLSILEEQLPIYDQLAEHDGLRVHAYAVPDTQMPEHNPGLTIHLERAEEIRRSWFVVYDGAGIDVNKCALLAEERESRAFYGFWTYDPDTVDWIIDHLHETYGIVEPA
jgi:hypothetical protein